jgi:hypothetical protein
MQIPRFSEITTFAYKELIRCSCKTLPIRLTDFADNTGEKIILVSFQEYIKISGLDIQIEDLTLGADFNDGYAIKELRQGLRMVLYNAQTNARRLWYTIYHEVGHLICGHNKHGDIEEVEANFFASQLLMPNAVIRYLADKKYAVTNSFLMDCFGVSCEAAKKKMDYLNNYGYVFRNTYDDDLIALFIDGLERQYPLLEQVSGVSDPIEAYYGSQSNYQKFMLNEQAFIDPDL